MPIKNAGPYSADVISGMMVDLPMDAFNEALTAVMIGVLIGIPLDLLVGANVLPNLMIVEFDMPAPSEGFGC